MCKTMIRFALLGIPCISRMHPHLAFILHSIVFSSPSRAARVRNLCVTAASLASSRRLAPTMPLHQHYLSQSRMGCNWSIAESKQIVPVHVPTPYPAAQPCPAPPQSSRGVRRLRIHAYLKTKLFCCFTKKRKNNDEAVVVNLVLFFLWSEW